MPSPGPGRSRSEKCKLRQCICKRIQKSLQLQNLDVRVSSITKRECDQPNISLAVMQRARTCGSREQLASISLRTMHHDGTMMGNAAFSDRTSQYHCSLSPTRRPLARPAPMATMRGERKGGGTGWPSVLPSTAPPTSRHQKGCRQRRHTHARVRVLRFHFR